VTPGPTGPDTCASASSSPAPTPCSGLERVSATARRRRTSACHPRRGAAGQRDRTAPGGDPDAGDHHRRPGFAPGPESLQVSYNIAGWWSDGEVPDPRRQLSRRKLFERDLAAAELADGNGKTLQWNGTIDNGARNGRHATPLMAPFKAELFNSATVKSDGPFSILYHSIALDFGRHTRQGDAGPGDRAGRLRPSASQRARLRRWTGGRRGHRAATKAALRRFQRANHEVRTQALLAETGTVDPRLSPPFRPPRHARSGNRARIR